VKYRRCIELQARLIAKYLTGEIAEYPAFTSR
jgi:CRISPR-associated protein Cas1